MVTIYIPFATATGEVEMMAEAVSEGVREHGGTPVMAYVPPLESRMEMLMADRLRRMLHERCLSKYPVANVPDLLTADGAAFGTPTIYAGPASEMKNYIDSIFEQRRDLELFNKPAATFTATHVSESGQELTKLALWAPLSLLGMLLVGIPQTVPNVTVNYDESMVLGLDHRTHPAAPRMLSQAELTQCHVLGARLALIAARVTDVAGSDILLSEPAPAVRATT